MTATAPLRIAVLGSGSTVAQLRGEGIRVSGVCGDHHLDPQSLKVCDADRPDAEDVACDILIVATKAHQARQALTGLMQNATQPSVPPPTPKAVLPKAAAHRSSTLQDVEAGRRTEIDCLNGAVVHMGQRHGIATPANDAVASLVRDRETGRST